jgi:hypothetical protein
MNLPRSSYKLVFNFIIPIYSASKQMNKKMNEFKQQMHQNQQQQQSSTTARPQTSKSGLEDDYIDYEEIK